MQQIEPLHSRPAELETVYGTPPASGFTRMPFASTTLGAEQPLLNSELLGHGRDPLARSRTR